MLTALVAASLVALASAPSALQSPLSDADAAVVSRIRGYATRYVDTMQSVVAHERYEQSLTARRATPRTTELKSDVLSLRLAGGRETIWFRDVYEVDGRKVRDREDRLLRLLESNAPGRLDDLRRIAAEGARFNLGSVPRTTNVPDLVFAYLTAGAGHITLSSPKDATIRGERVRVFRFEEVGTPTIVRGTAGRDLPARGRVWVEPGSGAVVRSEVVLGDTTSTATTVVEFVAHPRVAVRVPQRMDETFRSPSELGVGTATYSDLRVFGVNTAEQIRKPPPGAP
ncbi:MAG: hypothetical protein U0P30_10760 [Vicinamibacterales bacterium]